MTFLDLFDAPQMAPNCTERISSNVAPQAPAIDERLPGPEAVPPPGGPAWWMRIRERAEDQVRELYLRVLTRTPTPEEMQMTLESLSPTWRRSGPATLESEQDEGSAPDDRPLVGPGVPCPTPCSPPRSSPTSTRSLRP